MIPQPDQLGGNAFYGLSEEGGVQIASNEREREGEGERERTTRKKRSENTVARD